MRLSPMRRPTRPTRRPWQIRLLAAPALVLLLALQSCVSSSEISPKELAQVYWDLGRAYRGSGDYTQAADYLSKALTFDPSIGALHVELAQTFVLSGQVAQAAAILEALPASDRDNLLVAELLAYIRLQQGQNLEALELLRPRRLELGPAGYGNLLIASYRLGRVEEGLEYLAQLPAAWLEENNILRAVQALFLLEEGRRQEAILTLETLAAGVDPYFRFKLADIYAEDQAYLQEIQLLEALYRELGPSASIASRLALRYADELGDAASAREWADRLATLDAELAAELLKNIGTP